MNNFAKALLFFVFFCLFHSGFDLTGWAFLKPFCGVSESVFQHMKMGFWAYVLLMGVEYLWLKKKARDTVVRNFLFSRLLSAVVVPWVIVLTWYLLPAFASGPVPLWLDLVWAALCTYLSGLFVIQVERETERVEFSPFTKTVVVVLWLLSAFLFVFFTYKLPWIDIFAEPKSF